MVPSEFDAQITRLKLRFGEKAFDLEFKKRLFKSHGFYSVDEFARIVDRIIESRPHTRPPLLADFRETGVKNSYAAETNIEGCSSCDDGWVLANPVTRKGKTVGFRCNCIAGQRLSSRIPVWNRTFLSEYQPEKLQVVEGE